MGRESKIKKLRREGILEPVRIDRKRASTLKKIFIWVPAIFVTVAIVFGVWAYSAKDTEATVNGRKITTQKVEEMLANVKQNMQQQGADPNAKEQEGTILRYKNDIVQMMIEQKVFEVFADKNNIKADEKEITKKIDEEITKMKQQFPKEEDFVKQITQSPVRNMENLRKEIDKSFRPQMVEEAVLKALYEKIKVTETDAKTYFESPSQIVAQRILFKIPEKATEEEIKKIETTATDVKNKLFKKEITFDKAVETYSQDDATKINKGTVTLYEGGLVDEPELFIEAKKLQTPTKLKPEAEISSLIKTKIGFNLLKITSMSYVREQYNKPESAQIKEIIIKGSPSTATDEEKAKDKTKAEGLAKTLQTGKEKFEVIADRYAEDKEATKKPKTIYKGGQDATIDTAIFGSLTPGKFTNAIKVGDNYSIMQLIAKFPAETATFEKYKIQVIDTLTQKQKAEARKVWLEEQKKLVKVSLSNPWNKIVGFYDTTIGAFFQDMGNWIRQYTVETKPATTNTTTPGNIQIPGMEGGTTQDFTIPVTDPSQGGQIPVPPAPNNP
jgi:hypothetical protein